MAAIITGIVIVGGWRVFLAGKPIGGVTPAMGGLAGAIIVFLIVYLIRRALRGPDDALPLTPVTE
jgi:hypothetical protein